MKTTLPRTLASASLIALAAASTARPSHAESLADAVAYAYETNPGLQAQRASLRAIDENYDQARAGYGPTVSGSASETSYHERLGGQTSYANTDSENLSITQPLYTGGRVRNQLNAAEAQILAGRESLRRFELDLLQRVVTAYVGVQRDTALLKVNQDTVAVLEKEVADTRARFDVREVTMTDVAEAIVRLAQARVTLANAQAALEVSRAQYVSTIGQAPGELAPPPALDTLPATIDQALDAGENNNPFLLAAKYTEQKSRAQIAEARATRLPSISAQYSLQHNPFLPYNSQTYNYASIGTVTLNQPIFTSGQIESGIRQAIETNNTDRLNIDDARQQVILAVSTAWEQLASDRKQIVNLDDSVKAGEFSFYGNREESKLALRTTIDVLNAELELTSAQQALIRERAAEYVDRVQLLAAMGVLTPTLLSSRVNLYDPAANFRRVRHKGETPLEWPARALDAIGAPRVGPEPPASLAGAKSEGSSMPATPQAETPILSILSTLDKPPPEPK
jgi:outer membrane protein/S-layer protein transport system outer membrane protein